MPFRKEAFSRCPRVWAASSFSKAALPRRFQKCMYMSSRGTGSEQMPRRIYVLRVGGEIFIPGPVNVHAYTSLPRTRTHASAERILALGGYNSMPLRGQTLQEHRSRNSTIEMASRRSKQSRFAYVNLRLDIKASVSFVCGHRYRLRQVARVGYCILYNPTVGSRLGTSTLGEQCKRYSEISFCIGSWLSSWYRVKGASVKRIGRRQ